MIKMKKKGNLKDPSPPPLKKITGQKFRSNLLKRFEGSIRSIIFSRRIGLCTLTRDYRSKFSLFFQVGCPIRGAARAQVARNIGARVFTSERGSSGGWNKNVATTTAHLSGPRVPKQPPIGVHRYWFGSFNLCPGHHRRAVFDFYGSPLSRGERNNHSSLSIDYISKFRRTICSYFIVWRIERNLERGIIDWILLIEGNEKDRID